MAVKKEIIVVIDLEGLVNLDFVHHKGAECKADLAPVEKALGAKAKEVKAEDVARKKKSTTAKAKAGT